MLEKQGSSATGSKNFIKFELGIKKFKKKTQFEVLTSADIVRV